MQISDQYAVNLAFVAGLSTAEIVSDLSGRGVYMGVVRSALNKLDCSVSIESKLGTSGVSH